MFFFQSRDFALSNSVKTCAVYRRKTHGYGVFVCGVSRPKSKSYVEENASIKTTCNVMVNGTPVKFDAWLDNSDGTNEYIHSKKDYGSTVVMIKTASTNPSNLGVQFIPLKEFLNQYELVVGYTDNGKLITNSMLDSLETK